MNKNFISIIIIILLLFLPFRVTAQEDASSSQSAYVESGDQNLPSIDPVAPISFQEIASIIDEDIEATRAVEIKPGPVFNTPVFSQSANKRAKKILRKLSKKNYNSQESIRAVVENVDSEKIDVYVIDSSGKKANIKVQRTLSDGNLNLFIKSKSQFKPGKYRIVVDDQRDDPLLTQDFSWGVLAINTNKSVYKENETAEIYISVLDENGNMVCDAIVDLQITDPNGEVENISNSDGGISANQVCVMHEFTLEPDYKTSYKTSVTGDYKMNLTAMTKNGSYSISDTFFVEENPKISVERISATRIYPPEVYPMIIKITAESDFKGRVRDVVPESFDIMPLESYGGRSVQKYSSTKIISEDLENIEKVLGANTFLQFPFEGVYVKSQGFGEDVSDPQLVPIYNSFGVVGHDGIDFKMPVGTKIFAVDDGEVVRAKEKYDYGTTIVLKHKWGKTYYGHLSQMLVDEGDKIKKGDIIALSGDTGISTGPHLHFSIKPDSHDFFNGYYGKVDPAPFIKDENTKQVLGVKSEDGEVSDEQLRAIEWEVELKKGESIAIGYEFKAPQISPQFYTIGKLVFFDSKNKFVLQESRKWQIAADAIVVTGGIDDSDARFGGIQRKVEFVNGNWYAFYSDGGEIFYKKSSDGSTWNSPVTVSDSDTDNFSPSIAANGNIIHAFWVDTNSNTNSVVQGRRIDTGSSDAQGTLCSDSAAGQTFGTSSTTFMLSVADLSATSALVTYSDTSTDTEVNALEIEGLSGTCTVTDVSPGNITFGTQGAGFTASDMPVLASRSAQSSNFRPMAVFQDGRLSSSLYDTVTNEWRQNNATIAADTNTMYSVTSNGYDTWVLSASTTDTNLYHYPKANTGAVETSTAIDADIGGAAADMTQENVDIDCSNGATDCKIVFIDNADTTSPDLVFIDCDNADCSTKTTTLIDSDTGDASIGGSPKLHCPTSTNCKIVYGDMAVAAPDAVFIDCGDATCSGTAGTCTSGTRTCTIVDTDLGLATTTFKGDVYCPSDVSSDTDCKFIFLNDHNETNDAIWFADCSNASCSTRDALTSIVPDINGTNTNNMMSLYCNASADCQVLFHDAFNGDLTLRDCSNSACSAANATTDIDSDVGTTGVNVPNDIDCTAGASDCKILYADGSQNEVNFVDCQTAGCTTSVITKIDDTAGGIVNQSIDIDCISSIDCKGVFVGKTDAGTEDIYFLDCDNETCESGSVVDLDDPQTRAGLDCPATDDCKLVYYDLFVSATNMPVRFADCTNEDCMPEWETLTAPWSGETNIIGVSLSYDSTNTDLYASIIKDASEQAYFKTSDASTVSWGTETSFGFTSGDLNHLSTNYRFAGSSQFGTVLRQGTNLEFSGVPSTGPTLDQIMRHGKWFSNGVEQPFTF